VRKSIWKPGADAPFTAGQLGAWAISFTGNFDAALVDFEKYIF
jgi:hypothetical protein